MMNSYVNGNSYDYLPPGSSTIAHLEMNGINPGSMTTVSLEQALERVQELRKENSDLRDQLKENNEIMKQQYQNLVAWKEKIRQSSIQNKEKYDHAKKVILDLQEEKSALKKQLEEFGSVTDGKQQTAANGIGDNTRNQIPSVEQVERLQTELKVLQAEHQDTLLTQDQLQKDLHKENSRLEQENTEFSTKLQNVLSDSKSLKGENKEMRGKIQDLESQLSALKIASSPHGSDVIPQNLANIIDSSPDRRTKVQERNQAAGQVSRHTKESESTATHGDIQSLRSQVMTLINEVTESQNRLKETSEALEKKSQIVAMLEQTLHNMQQDMQAQKLSDGAQIENLQVSVKSFEEALNSERKELMNTRKQMADMRLSFNKIVSENKELRDKLEASKESTRQRPSDSERQKLLDEIGRMTASLLGAEEAIAYRDQQLKDLKKENENLKSEIENTVPVLKAQAEVWKADFDAERAAREIQHHEKEKLKEEIKQLQIRNQQLQDEMESSSKRQFSEMQQKHAPTNYQQTLQQRLGVTSPPTGGYPQYNQQGGHNFGYPHANQHPVGQGVTYPPQYTQHQVHPNPYQAYPDSSRSSGENVAHYGQPSSTGSQNDEDSQLECPKCGQLCPDMDTLQIHVLECIEQENTV